MNIAILITFIATVTMMTVINKHKVVVYEFEKGIRFNKGKYVKTLDAGRYFVFSKDTWIRKVGLRPRIMNVPTQDVLSSDGVTLRTSVIMEYQVIEPYAAIVTTENYDQTIYAAVHAALREIIGSFKIEEVLEARSQINEMLLEKTKPKAAFVGVQLNSIVVKDIMFPGELKKIFTQVIQARKEGLAALEKARGESAALRHLANAAKMLDNNPNLLKLKLLQSTGNTLVVGLEEKLVMLDKKEKNSQK